MGSGPWHLEFHTPAAVNRCGLGLAHQLIRKTQTSGRERISEKGRVIRVVDTMDHRDRGDFFCRHTSAECHGGLPKYVSQPDGQWRERHDAVQRDRSVHATLHDYGRPGILHRPF